MKIVAPVFRDRRSLEKGQSEMDERPLVDRPARVILTDHDAKIRRFRTKRHWVAILVGAIADETVTPYHQAFEVINVRRFLLDSRHLIVTAVRVQPWDWERLFGAIVVEKRGKSRRLTKAQARAQKKRRRE